MIRVTTYEEYLEEPKSLSWEDCNCRHQTMVEAIGDDPDALELYGELMEASANYVQTRALWSVMDHEEKMEQNELRTARHDSVITHFNMLARYLKDKGKDTSWWDDLGADPVGYGRKAIGDFGCFLAFVGGINAR